MVFVDGASYYTLIMLEEATEKGEEAKGIIMRIGTTCLYLFFFTGWLGAVIPILP